MSRKAEDKKLDPSLTDDKVRKLTITLLREIHDLPADPRLFSGKNREGYWAALRQGQTEVAVKGCSTVMLAIRSLASRVLLQWMDNARQTGVSNSVTAKELKLALDAG